MATVIWGEGKIHCPCGQSYDSGCVRQETLRMGYRFHIEALQPCPNCSTAKYLVPISKGPIVPFNQEENENGEVPAQAALHQVQ